MNFEDCKVVQLLETSLKVLQRDEIEMALPMTAEQIAKKLNLAPLVPEGGYFHRTYASKGFVDTLYGKRNSMTAIYYLVTPDSFSALHVLKSDEIYHYYAGDTLAIHIVSPEGNYSVIKLGPKILEDKIPQFVVPAGYWQCSGIDTIRHGFSLVGTTVSPGFDFQDFSLIQAKELESLPTPISLQLKPFLNDKRS